MRPKELLLASLLYIIGATGTYFIAVRFSDDPARISQVVGTFFGGLRVAWLYQWRYDEIASAKVRLPLGVTLALTCVAQGLIFQRFFQWMEFPDIGILTGTIAALVFPFILWNHSLEPFLQKCHCLQKAMTLPK